MTGFYKNGKKLVLLDSADAQFNIMIDPTKSLALNSLSSLSSISVDLTEAELGSKNPAMLHFYAMVNCSSYNGQAIVESVTGMSISVTNGSSTTYINNTEDTWYTTITGANYSHGPVGLPSVTLNWSGTKVVRHTVKEPNALPVTTISNTPINVTRSQSASLPTPD